MPNLKVIGQLTTGVNFDVNGVSLLVDQSVRAVKDLYIELEERIKAKKVQSKKK